MNRLALLAIVVSEKESVEALNGLLHVYAPYIIGRMGLPCRDREVSLISVALDAPQDQISALSGKLGMLKGVQTKAVYAKTEEIKEENR